MSTRADNFTQLKTTPDSFSDFLGDMTPHPVTGDILRVRNEKAVKESLRNILLTHYGERPFQPNIGSNIHLALFEPDDDVTANDLQYHIENAINAYEPRVQLIQVNVQSLPEENKLGVQIFYALINTQNVQNLNLILRRVR
jgi:phage baseplate assembly protein W